MLDWNDIVGKTIESIDEEFGDNVIVINFTDKSNVVIDTDTIDCGLHVPALFNKENYGGKNVE